MDLDQLSQRRQMALYMAEHATSESSRQAHLGLAQGYAELIARAKDKPVEVPAR